MPTITKKRQKAYYFGIFAECIAIILLILKGYRIIATRERNTAGEIDIIAIRRRFIVFIEVKARKNKQQLQHVITPVQQERITRAAGLFLAKHRMLQRYDTRFDAMLVAPFTFPCHIKNAWIGT